MDWALVIGVIAVLIALVSLSAALWAIFRTTTDPDLDELAGQVLSLRKAHRAEQMRRVRETPPQAHALPDPDSPEGLQLASKVAKLSKDDWRRIAAGIDPTRRH